jgi:Winged helix DNA-binding domain
VAARGLAGCRVCVDADSRDRIWRTIADGARVGGRRWMAVLLCGRALAVWCWRYGEEMASSRSADRSLLAARLAAQRLSGAPAVDVVDATRHLLAVQGQDPRAARLALRARTAGGHASAVDHALTDERSLIITWVNRGTLHLIAAEDEPLLHALTTPQLLRNSDRRLRQEGVSAIAARRGITAIVKALGNDGPMTRAQLCAVLETAGVPTARQAMVHVLGAAAA